ncbi:MAG: DUF2442 domain-containing protein [Candidatus Sumerlaeota bacterium]|nr:DUF2442 domain-containing protein [Candidatus Sumerlaeota bacterium]
MFKIIQVKPLPQYRLWLKYDDGTEGIADLSDLAGDGVFSIWDDQEVFNSVKIGDMGELQWGEEVDLCPDALYLRITGKEPEDVFPAATER